MEFETIYEPGDRVITRDEDGNLRVWEVRHSGSPVLAWPVAPAPNPPGSVDAEVLERMYDYPGIGGRERRSPAGSALGEVASAPPISEMGSPASENSSHEPEHEER